MVHEQERGGEPNGLRLSLRPSKQHHRTKKHLGLYIYLLDLANPDKVVSVRGVQTADHQQLFEKLIRLRGVLGRAVARKHRIVKS